MSTSHISAILFFRGSGTSRSQRRINASGVIPMLRSAATECWVGLVFELTRRRHERHQRAVQEEAVLPADLVAHLTRGLQERQRLDIAYGAADFGDHHIGTVAVGIGFGHRQNAALDLVGDVRDDLDGVAEVLAAALLGDHRRIHLPGGHIRPAGQVAVEEALVVADVEIGLCAVLGDEHLAVLERVHGAGVDVEVGVELLHGDLQATGGQQLPEARRGETLTERRNHAAGDEEVLGGGLWVLA